MSLEARSGRHDEDLNTEVDTFDLLIAQNAQVEEEWTDCNSK